MINNMRARVKDNKKAPIQFNDRHSTLVYTEDGDFEVINIDKDKGTCTAKGIYMGADVKNVPINILEFVKEHRDLYIKEKE